MGNMRKVTLLLIVQNMKGDKMTYFKVKHEFDNKPKHNKNFGKTRHHYKDDIFIGGELYTQGEINILEKKKIHFYYDMFEQVEIPKTKTYWFFGARFEV